MCNIFKLKCPAGKQAKAVKACVQLLSKPRTVACLLAVPTDFNPMDLFQKCIQAICFDDFFACSTVINFTRSCPRGRILRRLKCTQK